MATARMEIMRTVTAKIVAFQNVRDGKQESPAKFPGCPDFSTGSEGSGLGLLRGPSFCLLCPEQTIGTTRPWRAAANIAKLPEVLRKP